MNSRNAVRAVPAVAALATGASLVALVVVWQWAVANNSGADFEHQELLRTTFSAALLIAFLVVAARLIDFRSEESKLRTVGTGAAAAFVVVVTSVALTMLAMWAFRSHTDPGEVGRRLFPLAYLSAVALSLLIGVAVALAGPRGTRHEGVLAAGVAIVLVGVAWAYLAADSSDLNRCMANMEFPLDTSSRGECSGY